MKSLFEYLINSQYKLGNIIFELDESSQELLGSNTQHIFEMGKYYDKINKTHNSGNRLVWTSKDDDSIRMGGHATDRLDRSIEKGGDGEHIEQREIIDMFIWAWTDLLKMYDNGYLSTDEYDSNVICCRCYIYEDNDKLFIGAKPRTFEKNLWAAFFIEEKADYKIDVIIKTLFRGMLFKHSPSQERLIITIDGKVKQIIPQQQNHTHKEHELTGYDSVLKHTKITVDPIEACYIAFKTSVGNTSNYIPYDSRGYVTKYVIMDENNDKTRWSFATTTEKDIAYEEDIPFIKVNVKDAIAAAKRCLYEGIPIFLGHKYDIEFITCANNEDYEELNLNELNKLWI